MRRALAATALALAVGCHHEPPPPAAIRVAHESDVLTLDPSAETESVTQSVLSSICEPLAGFDRDMQLRPMLALNWTNPDENTWLIQLRPSVSFHDGRTLTADDVAFSLDRARTLPTSAVRGRLSALDEVRVITPHTLRLHTREPEPLLMTQLAYVLIVPRGQVFGSHTLTGTGPYRLVSWDRGRALTVEAFDHYWGTRPSINRVEFVPVENGAPAMDLLRRHQADVQRWVPETMAAEVRGIPGVRVASRPGLATYYLWLDSRAPKQGKNPLADRRVRRALSLALDRKAIIAALDGNGVAANQLVQQGVFGHIGGLPELRHDPAAARALMAEAGFTAGFEITLVHRDQAPLDVVSSLIAHMLAEAGIQVHLDTPPWPEILSRWSSASVPMLMAGWRFEEGDAAGFLRDCLFTRSPERGWGLRNPGYSDPELDRLIVENMGTFQESKRLQQYERLMRHVMDDMPLVPLYHKLNLYAVSDRVQWTPRLDGKLLPAEMSLASP